MNRLCLRSWPLAEEQLDWKVIGNQSLRSASASEIQLSRKAASRAARSSLGSSQAQSLAAGLASSALQAKLRKIYKRCVA